MWLDSSGICTGYVTNCCVLITNIVVDGKADKENHSYKYLVNEIVEMLLCTCTTVFQNDIFVKMFKMIALVAMIIAESLLSLTLTL